MAGKKRVQYPLPPFSVADLPCLKLALREAADSGFCFICLHVVCYSFRSVGYGNSHHPLQKEVAHCGGNTGLRDLLLFFEYIMFYNETLTR